jgi:hypothetical protein
VSLQEITQELASIERNSTATLEALRESGRSTTEADLTCWHCRSLNLVSDDESAEFYDQIERALPTYLPTMALTRIAFGFFELWERALPTTSWLTERLEQFQVFAEQTGSCPEGWSYEPTDRSPGYILQAWADREDGDQ